MLSVQVAKQTVALGALFWRQKTPNGNLYEKLLDINQLQRHYFGGYLTETVIIIWKFYAKVLSVGEYEAPVVESTGT